MTSNQHSVQDDFAAVREGIDPGHPTVFFDAVDRIEEQLEAAQAESKSLKMWLVTDVARARGLAESMMELPTAVWLEGIEENAAEIVRLINIEDKIGSNPARGPATYVDPAVGGNPYPASSSVTNDRPGDS